MIDAKYLDDGRIAVMIDEMVFLIQDDMSDPIRKIVTEWEEQGNVIRPYSMLPVDGS